MQSDIFARGRGTSMIICILGMCRARDPNFQPWSALKFRSEAYHFHKFPQNTFRSITILHFGANFAVPETIIFKIRSGASPWIRRSVAVLSTKKKIFYLFCTSIQMMQSDIFARGGGGVLPYIIMHIGYVPRERPPFSALVGPKFPFRSI